MLSDCLVVARKELVDHLSDRRALVASLLYVGMGPAVVLLVSHATAGRSGPREQLAVLTGMGSVFALVSAFVGGVNVAIDVMAGERERRSLLPLLLTPASRSAIVIGKWLGVGAFAVMGMALNCSVLAAVLVSASIGGVQDPTALWQGLAVVLLGIAIPCGLLAASAELLVSTMCASIKEAHTYLSLLAFAPMAVGMGLVFHPGFDRGPWLILPLTGHHLQLVQWMNSGAVSGVRVLTLAATSLLVAAVSLAAVARSLRRDAIVYGH
jgi:sodium transport system permease protein